MTTLVPVVGSRIELIEMPDDPDPVPPGTCGTITAVTNLTSIFTDESFQLQVDWDNGRTLNMIVPPDRFKFINHSQLTETSEPDNTPLLWKDWA
jgi:hypothetical protein